MQILFTRQKNSAQDLLHFFADAQSWITCPLHALATMIAVCQPVAPALFHDLIASAEGRGQGGAKYLNGVLASLTELAAEQYPDVTRKLTSHSIRAGPASCVGEHLHIPTHFLHFRGGWDGITNLYEYIAGTIRTDAPVGRILSHWDKAFGGVAPEPFSVNGDILPRQDYHLYQEYVMHLMGSVIIQHAPQLKQVLTAMLLLHYQDVKQMLGGVHQLVLRMECCPSVPVTKVEEWALIIRAWWSLNNGAFCKINGMSPSDTVNVSSMTDVLHRVAASADQTQGQLTQLQNIVVRQQHQLDEQGALLREHGTLLRQFINAVTSNQMQLSSSSSTAAASSTALASSTPAAARLNMSAESGHASLSTPSAAAVSSNTYAAAPVFHSGRGKKRNIAELGKPRFEVSLTSLKAEKLFYRWYAEEWHQFARCDGLMRCARAMSWLKALVPHDTVIPARPTQLEERETWQGMLTHLAGVVGPRARAVLQRVQNSDGKVRKVIRPADATVWSIDANMKHAPADEFNFSRVKDQATPSELQFTYLDMVR
jgi:hypothetical protein